MKWVSTGIGYAKIDGLESVFIFIFTLMLIHWYSFWTFFTVLTLSELLVAR